MTKLKKLVKEDAYLSPRIKALMDLVDFSKFNIKRYIANLKDAGHPRAKELEAYNKGARCTFGNYKCTNRCNFIEGVTETRQI